MKKICLVVSDYLTGNKIFNSGLHRDNFVDRFVQLKKAFGLKGYDLSTQDINNISDSDFVIYASNMPKIMPSIECIGKSYLILSESAFIRPDNYDIDKHAYFNKIFTWSDELVDGNKYIKLNYAHSFPEHINKELINKKKLCVLIAGNKKPQGNLTQKLLDLDLYKERENAIRWFEKNHLEDFDLYGVGWGEYKFVGPKILRALNRVPFLPSMMQRLTRKEYISYKGSVENKKPIMEQYKFSICYENARDIPGYITEKIFDSFFAGCVPIYWGANNVTDFIPVNTFIDKRDFMTYEELYLYLKNMPDNEYLNYLENIEAYLSSEMSLPFKSEGFVQTIIQTMLK